MSEGNDTQPPEAAPEALVRADPTARPVLPIPDYGDPDLRSAAEVAFTLVESGMFPDVRRLSQGLTKILAGRELGIGPIASLAGLHVMEGKVEPGAHILASLVRRDGKYDYQVLEHSDAACRIRFWRPSDGLELGESSFTIEDAKRAGLADRPTWKRYPRAMLFARAMSQGVRWYCPDVTGGTPIYAAGEATYDDEVEARDVDNARVLDARLVDDGDGERTDADDPGGADEVADAAATIEAAFE